MDDKSCDEYATHISGKVKASQEMEGERVIKDVDEVGKVSFLALPKMAERQAVNVPPCTNGETWQDDGSDGNEKKYSTLVDEWEELKPSTKKENDEAGDCKVMGSEEGGEGACSEKKGTHLGLGFEVYTFER